MYHIKEDKRVKRSADLICNGLLECLKTKSFSEITVTDVQKASTVGRATFYRLFDQLPDVLSYMLDSVFMNIKKIRYDKKRSIHEQFLEPAIGLWMENADLLQVIFDANRLDIIFESNKRSITMFYEAFDSRLEDEYLKEYFMSIASSILIGVIGTWLKNGRKETAAELAEVFININKITLKK